MFLLGFNLRASKASINVETHALKGWKYVFCRLLILCL